MPTKLTSSFQEWIRQETWWRKSLRFRVNMPRRCLASASGRSPTTASTCLPGAASATRSRRYIALNGLQSNAEVPLTSQQVEAVLDLLDQSRQATHANNISAADEVIVALSRSLGTSGLLKATKETSNPSATELTTEEFVEPMKVSAQ